MALVGSEMKSKFQSRIHSGLARVFGSDVAAGQGYPGIADPFWAKMADAISDIAMDVVNEIQQNAEVVPGQQVTGVDSVSGPVTAATASPGKIL
jgi:hypothetical protein